MINHLPLDVCLVRSMTLQEAIDELNKKGGTYVASHAGLNYQLFMLNGVPTIDAPSLIDRFLSDPNSKIYPRDGWRVKQ